VNRITVDSEGEPVDALLHQPRSPDRQVGVVVSPGRAATLEELNWLAAPLADAGYTVLVQGYRTGRTRYQLRDVQDVRCAVSWLQSEMRGSIRRIAVIGHSRGASASLRAAASDPRIDATVALSAPVDVARYMNALREHSPSRYRTLAEGYGATPSGDPHYYAIISPLSHASFNASPVLLIHGTDDMVAPKEHSEWMHAALVSHGRARVRLELIAGAGHFFESRFNGYLHAQVVELVVEWLHDTISQAPPIGNAGEQPLQPGA